MNRRPFVDAAFFVFADLPPDTWGERYLHTGILKAIDRKKGKEGIGNEFIE